VNVTTRVICDVVVVPLAIDVAAGIVWEAAAITVVNATKGTIIAETDAAGVVYASAKPEYHHSGS